LLRSSGERLARRRIDTPTMRSTTMSSNAWLDDDEIDATGL
jgi:hypothetical protein